MKRNDRTYKTYVEILREELIPAMGCTEPVAIAYGAAKAAEVLGIQPDRVLVEASGNIIKNVKSVIVPNTGGLKGIAAAAAAGIAAGKADRQLEVIAEVTEEDKRRIREFLEHCPIQTRPAQTDLIFDIILTLWREESYVKLRISDAHTNIVSIEKDGVTLFAKDGKEASELVPERADRALLNVRTILEFAECVDIADIGEILDRQIVCNMAIAEEGLGNSYGANIGSVLMQVYGDDVKVKARAWAAAGSDARMNGCELPVVINSGSGNQGMTASIPVIVYAREQQADMDMLYRALVVSNLVTIHQKTGIGRLSAYCGAVSAGAGAGAGIAYLQGDGYDEIVHTIVNALAITSGIVCDGAKASCAAKIAASVDSGILGYHMYKKGQEFRDGDGIVKKGVEATIETVGRLGKEGMRETDKEIIRIMTEE